MTPQMHLVVIKETGHILAGAAQAVAAGDPTPQALVGTDFPVMLPAVSGTTIALFTLIPADLLEVKTVAYDSAVLANPQSHVVDGGRVARIPAAAATGNPILKTTSIELVTSVADVPVAVFLASSADQKVDRRAQAGKFGSDTAKTLTLTLTIMPGDTPAAIPTGVQYGVLIACAGRRLEWKLATA
jgi:hypothetical protein